MDLTDADMFCLLLPVLRSLHNSQNFKDVIFFSMIVSFGGTVLPAYFDSVGTT